MKILLDTNFIMTCLKFKIDLFSEINRNCHFKYDIFILDKSIEELKKLKSKLSLDLIEKFKIEIIAIKIVGTGNPKAAPLFKNGCQPSHLFKRIFSDQDPTARCFKN